MRATLLVALAAGPWAAAAPGPKEKDPPKSHPLAGEWLIVGQDVGGKADRLLYDNRIWIFATDGKFADNGGSPKTDPHWQTFKADDKADPPTLDVIDPVGTMRCLYRLDGDKLIVALPVERNGPRPKTVESVRGSSNLVLTFKKVAPKK
jgi:uncharacterized protein (TIGR03067 family)